MSEPAKKTTRKRPFIGMYFKCCHVYTRLYLNKTGRAFLGHCPKCAKKAKVIVSPTGSKDRVFQAD